jgi:hypothetical protein
MVNPSLTYIRRRRHYAALRPRRVLKLVDIDEELRHLKITIREKARHAEPEVRGQLEKVMRRIACSQPRVAAARAQVEHWIKDKAKDALRFGTKKSPKTETEN